MGVAAFVCNAKIYYVKIFLELSSLCSLCQKSFLSLIQTFAYIKGLLLKGDLDFICVTLKTSL